MHTDISFSSSGVCAEVGCNREWLAYSLRERLLAAPQREIFPSVRLSPKARH